MRSRAPHGWIPWLLLAVVLVAGWLAWPRPVAVPVPALKEVAPSTQSAALPPVEPAPGAALPAPPAAWPGFLPAEARDTIALIRRGGPFPHRQDGSVFGNREGRLPRHPRGWYREYTVDTPGLDHRGARRIVTGGNPPREWYYTADHYDSFRRFEPPEEAQ